MIIRPYQPADLEAVYSLIRAVAKADRTHIVSHDGLRANANPEANTAVALVDNKIVGFAWWDKHGHPDIQVDGWVHPDHRRQGVGTALLVAAESAARKAGAEHLIGRSYDDLHGAITLYRLRGFNEVRYFYQMSMSLTDFEIKPPDTPPGISVRSFEEADTRALYEADVESFSTSWGQQRQTLERWQRRMMAAIDPNLWVLIREGEHIVALCLGGVANFGVPNEGWISHLGVRPAYRGRGLGRLALMHGLLRLQDDDFARAGLHVDGENVPAMRLYESVGLRTARRRTHFAKQLRE
jgi:mycothiol synthase